MKELGNVLRRQREKLGLSLDAMEQQTKIRKRYLEALEAGDWGPLPGTVYARGFVRSYAEHLQLDGRALLFKYVDSEEPTGNPEAGMTETRTGPGQPDLVPTESIPSPASMPARSAGFQAQPLSASQFRKRPSEQRRRAGNSRRSRSWIGQTVAVVAILVLLGAGAWALNRTTRQHTPSPVTTVAPGNGGKPARTGGRSQGGQSGNRTPKLVHQQPPTPVVQVIAQPLQGSNLTYLVKTNQPLRVVLSAANAAVWTRVTADGVSVDGAGGETLNGGSAKPFAALRTLTFVIGNIPAAVFAVDGQSVTLPNVNTVLNITFTKAAR